MIGDLPRRLVAEAVGTLLLVLFGAGSIVAALVAGDGRLDYAGLGVISLSFAVVIAVVIYAFGSTSGAHINPAVTIALATGGRFPWAEVPFYLVAQFVGAFAGALLIVGGFGSRATELGGVGMTSLGTDVNAWQGLLFEAAGTFLLMFTIMALAIDRRAPTGWSGLMIGLSVAGAIFLIGPLTGGSLNPARTFGPYLTNTLFGGSTPWAQFGVYLIGPIIGAVLAVAVYELVARPASEVPAAAEQGTAGEITGGRRSPDGAPDATAADLAGEVPRARRPHDDEIRERARAERRRHRPPYRE